MSRKSRKKGLKPRSYPEKGSFTSAEDARKKAAALLRKMGGTAVTKQSLEETPVALCKTPDCLNTSTSFVMYGGVCAACKAEEIHRSRQTKAIGANSLYEKGAFS